MQMGSGWFRYVTLALPLPSDQSLTKQNEPEVVQGWKGVPRIILTPNIMEFKRLCEAKVGLMSCIQVEPMILTNRELTIKPTLKHSAQPSPELWVT